MERNYLTMAEAAQFFGVHSATLRNWTKHQGFPMRLLSGRPIVLLEDAKEWVTTRPSWTPPKKNKGGRKDESGTTKVD